MSQNATPAAIEDGRRQLTLIATDMDILEREGAIGTDHAERLKDLNERKAKLEADLAKLEERWKAEAELVKKIRALHDQITTAFDAGKKGDKAATETPVDTDALRKDLAAQEAALKTLQGESPLLKVTVDGQAVAEVVANWTGNPRRPYDVR